MVETCSDFPVPKNDDNVPEIPIEIVSDEEMAFIEAALASASSFYAVPATRSPTCSSQFHRNAKSIRSITVVSKRRLSKRSEPDIEDSDNLVSTQKKSRLFESFLRRFRRKRGLSVTDLTQTEWCQKQMEFALCLGGRKTNKAMSAGIARHVELEEEVMKRVEVKVKSREEYYALKLLNFINGVNQLLFEGLTRELPVIGFLQGIWMVGMIDEIRMPLTENGSHPILIDTKTRARDTLPSEPQRRNGRLQLMCYKYLWDNLVADNFPSEQFFDFFELNPQHNLCEDLRVTCADSGFSVLTLDDVVRCYKNTCRMLLPAHDQLLLRYEFQKDHSLIGEDKFSYDSDWLEYQIGSCLKFWVGEREATYAPEEERWKCRFCEFASVCPAYLDDTKDDSNSSNQES
ncbi:hypothetical protein L6164_021940 [Bauhinia variegata]|uniref:Uncharacterized protein n=1 Tax=Bauhinia variegata TaxID=167791 RepID=A0ACB9MDB2_BAUVA|nr:hypothetical protein L6164_021940 [Bauhinia variegata]